MALFDFYIMVDWSGAARRRGRRSDTIWIAYGPTIDDAPITDSPFSRTEAIKLIKSLLLREIGANRRVLVCFDFAYGYPVIPENYIRTDSRGSAESAHDPTRCAWS